MSFRPKRGDLRRLGVIFVCLLIFLFALEAKLELYGQGFHVSIHPCNSSKLRLDASTAKAVLPVMVAIWLAVMPLYRPSLHNHILVERTFITPVPLELRLWYRDHVFRPPPALLF